MQYQSILYLSDGMRVVTLVTYYSVAAVTARPELSFIFDSHSAIKNCLLGPKKKISVLDIISLV